MWKLAPIFCLLGVAAVHAAPPSSRHIVAHERRVVALAMSADGMLIATGGDDRTVKLWNAESGVLRSSFHVSETITAVAIREDGTRLGVGMWDGTLLVCGVPNSAEKVSIRAHRENITAVAFSADGDRIATASGDDSCRLWNAARGTRLLTIEPGNDYDVSSVAFSRGGKLLALGDGENSTRIYDSASGDEIHAFGGHDEAVSAVAFLGDKYVASGSWDDTIRIWNLRLGGEETLLRGHTDDVIALASSADGTRLVSAAADGTVRVWNVTGGKPLQVYRPKGTLAGVAISANGKRVAFVSGTSLFIEEVP